MSTFTLEVNKGASYPNEPYIIWLYPNKSSDRSVVENEVIYGPSGYSHSKGLEHLCDQIYSEGIVDAYSIYTYDSYPNVSENNWTDFKSSFDTWLDNQSFSGYVGTHLGISSRINAGLADGGTPSGFTGAKSAISGTGHSTVDRAYQTPLHEALHTILEEEYYDIAPTEHGLGDIQVLDGHSSATPIGSQQSHWTSGDCDDSAPYAAHWQSELNSCEIQGVKETAEEDFN